VKQNSDTTVSRSGSVHLTWLWCFIVHACYTISVKFS